MDKPIIIPGFPYYFAIKSAAPYGDDKEVIWRVLEIRKYSEIEREIRPNSNGLVFLKNDKGKGVPIYMPDLEEMCEKLILSGAEMYEHEYKGSDGVGKKLKELEQLILEVPKDVRDTEKALVLDCYDLSKKIKRLTTPLADAVAYKEVYFEKQAQLSMIYEKYPDLKFLDGRSASKAIKGERKKYIMTSQERELADVYRRNLDNLKLNILKAEKNLTLVRQDICSTLGYYPQFLSW